MTQPPSLRCPAPVRTALLALVCLFVGLGTSPAVDANMFIQRTITLDGNFSDWEQPSNILTNPGQFSEDASLDDCDPNNLQPGDDLDCSQQASTGRDLRRFAFTFDETYLYMYVERFANSNNVTWWLFYLDLDNNGLM